MKRLIRAPRSLTGRYLAGALQSVLLQAWRDLEVVVIDDGSTDDTPNVLGLFLADPRVRTQRTDGLGQSRAKNLGIQLSRAPLIAFLDGDDEWLPAKLERQLPLFENPSIGVVYSPRTLMDADGRDLPFADREFDVAFSNAVVEHVGGRTDQERFVRELCRVAKRIFVTTPNRLFPVDPHTLLPVVHWLPDGRRPRRLDGVRPLSARELRSLFPYPVRIVNTGLTLIAVGGSAPSAGRS